MAIRITNHARDCGTKNEGGYYAVTEMSRRGTLVPWTWANDTMISFARPLRFGVAPRKHHRIDAEHLFHSHIWQAFDTVDAMRNSGLYKGAPDPQLQRLRRAPPARDAFALMHHVGEQFYSAAGKALEVSRIGPSERLQEDDAIAVAPYTKNGAIRMIYTHAKLPIFDSTNAMRNVLEYVAIESASHLEERKPVGFLNEDGEAREVSPDRAVVHVPQDASLDFNKYSFWWLLDYGLMIKKWVDVDALPIRATYDDVDWRGTLIKNADNTYEYPNNGRYHALPYILSYLERHGHPEFTDLRYEEGVYGYSWITKVVKVVKSESVGGTLPEHIDNREILTQKEIDAGVDVGVLPPGGEEDWLG